MRPLFTGMGHTEAQKEKWILGKNHGSGKQPSVPLQSQGQLARVSAKSCEARIRMGYTVWGNLPRREPEVRPKSLRQNWEANPSETNYRHQPELPEVEADTARGAGSLGSKGDGMRLRTGQKQKVRGKLQEYPWRIHTHLYASVCACHMRW